jgi:predicted phosphate transport protein (TIGR00153 family)
MRRFQVIPRDQGFYQLFEQASQNVAEAAEMLLAMVTDYDDPEASAAAIKQRESEGDETTHRIMRALATTFVTPFDREDIHDLASELDDILDETDAAADLFVLHRIAQPLPGMRQLAAVLVQIAGKVHEAISQLRSPGSLTPILLDLHRLEDQGDRIYRKTTAALFSGDYAALDVLRFKEVVDQLELAIDHCESVANTLETIALKHA